MSHSSGLSKTLNYLTSTVYICKQVLKSPEGRTCISIVLYNWIGTGIPNLFNLSHSPSSLLWSVLKLEEVSEGCDDTQETHTSNLFERRGSFDLCQYVGSKSPPNRLNIYPDKWQFSLESKLNKNHFYSYIQWFVFNKTIFEDSTIEFFIRNKVTVVTYHVINFQKSHWQILDS